MALGASEARAEYRARFRSLRRHGERWWMWKHENRYRLAEIEKKTKRYPIDLTDAEWLTLCLGADATRGAEWSSTICLPLVDLVCDASAIKMGRIWARPQHS
jgi:hypothetical protein